MRLVSGCVVASLFAFVIAANALQTGSSPVAARTSSAASKASSDEELHADPAVLFQQGQDALNRGRLDEAEHSFRQVLALNPQVAGAYANLGVVYMRRKQWGRALENLQKAEQFLPQVAGIRLNIGLAHYRQSEFLKAISPFESVVRDQPDSLQARRLLGQCYFFAERWADAVNLLEPLWTQESTPLDYLYVLMIAANRAGQKEVDEKALFPTGYGGRKLT